MAEPTAAAMRALLDQATAELKRLRLEVERLEEGNHEPIAIIGMGCRFPGGVSSPSSFWQMVTRDTDVITETTGRWPALGGDQPLRWAGLLDDVESFDAEFFGISPREAQKLDPQQRLLLEVSWEALERAGYTATHLMNSLTGVFVGSTQHDYGQVLLDAHALTDIYGITGAHASFAAGRLSYCLGLRGPSLALDTACSSSLVALHLASQSLRNDECDMALACGVNLMFATGAAASAFLPISPDGRCRTFDARANGFVRGEGCAVVVLKRLKDAQRDADPIMAVVHGSAVNHDGHTSGLTVPSAKAQAALVTQALANARVGAAQVRYIEAHGTATALGDPLEIEALQEALGASRPDGSQIAVGSVKANLGHTEAAAGLAGLCKVVLALQHGVIPRQLHFQTINPRIRLEGSPLMIPKADLPWPRGAAPRFAGLSSFSLSGTNAHVIIGEAPAPEAIAQGDVPSAAPATLLPLSARTADGLRVLAQAYVEFFTSSSTAHVSAAAAAYAAGVHREHHTHRLAVVGYSREDLAAALAAFLRDEPHERWRSGAGSPTERRPRVAFVFPGQGSQWLGMGQTLLRQEAVFRDTFAACDAAILAHAGWSVTQALQANPEDARLNQVDVVQPLLFAMQVSLAALWRAWGIEPDAVIGHSMGEVAAACVAGALDLESGAKIMCLRSRLVRQKSGRGAMAVVLMSPRDAEARMAASNGALSIAAINGGDALVIAGDIEAMRIFEAQLHADSVYFRRINVDYASHCAQMDELIQPIVDGLGSLKGGVPNTPFCSTVTGAWMEAGHTEPAYWARNLRQPVLFGEGLRHVWAAGCRIFIEVSPHPILLAKPDMVSRALASDAPEGTPVVVGSLRREQPESETLLMHLGELFTHGVAVDFSKLQTRTPHVPELPTYPWQRERHWVEAGQPRRHTLPGPHPLLGAGQWLSGPTQMRLWEQDVSVAAAPYLADHRVGDAIVLPAAAYLEMMLAAARDTWSDQPLALGDIALNQMLVLPTDGSVAVQLLMADITPAGGLVYVSSRQGDAWVRHAEARVHVASSPPQDDFPPVTWPEGEGMPGEALYQALAARDLYYGPAFRGVERAWGEPGAAHAWARLLAAPATPGYRLHPAFLDAALQPLILQLAHLTGSLGTPWLPVGVQRLVAHARPHDAVWSRTRLHPQTDTNSVLVDVQLLDDLGVPCAELYGLQLRPLARAVAAPPKGAGDDLLLAHVWVELPALPDTPLQPSDGSWLVLGDERGLGTALQRALSAEGAQVVQVTSRHNLQATLAATLAALPRCRGIINLWALDAPPLEVHGVAAFKTAQELTCDSTVQVIKAHVAQARRDAPRLWLVTSGAQTLPAESLSIAIEQAALWGLGRTLAYEHPELRCTCVDVALDASPLGLELAALALVREIASDTPEDELLLRPGPRRYGGRLTRDVQASLQSQVPSASPWTTRLASGQSTYLITGGLGGLGLHLAAWLVQQGARHLVLVGRRGEQHAEQRAAVETLRRAGAEVHVAAIDVADSDAMAGLMQHVQESMPPLRGVVHAAAVLDDGLFVEQTAERFARVFAPKALGAWNLHTLTRGLELDFFVLYASIASLIGSPGQSNYSAANAVLDALAGHRRALGLPALSVHWGAFAQIGLAAAAANRGARLSGRGVESLDPDAAVEILARLIGGGVTHMGVVALDVRQWLEFYPSSAASPRLALLLTAANNHTAAPATAVWRSKLQQASASAQIPLLEQCIREQMAAVLRLAPHRIGRETPFRNLGIDSLMGLELRNRLEAALGLRLSATAAYAHPTLKALAAFLAVELHLGRAPAATGVEGRLEAAAAEETPSTKEDLIAKLKQQMTRK